MNLYAGETYHIFNQGNNRRTIFYDESDYSLFKWKMKIYLPPFGDFISYCLMPNHFHIQFYVKNECVDRSSYHRRLKKFATIQSRFLNLNRSEVQTKPSVSVCSKPFIDLNEAIGILQRTYTRNFNNKYGCSGSLFRSGCKAKSNFNGKYDHEFLFLMNSLIDNEVNNYDFLCMNYIHMNPVSAKLVDLPEEWRFSSAREYSKSMSKNELRLCNLRLGEEIRNQKVSLYIP